MAGRTRYGLTPCPLAPPQTLPQQGSGLAGAGGQAHTCRIFCLGRPVRSQQGQSGLGHLAASSDWTGAVPLVGWSGFVPGLLEAAGTEGLSRPQAGPEPLAGPLLPVWLREGFSDPGARCSPSQAGVWGALPVCVFLGLRRGGKSDIKAPLHPTVSGLRKAPHLSDVPSFPLSPVPSCCAFPRRHSICSECILLFSPVLCVTVRLLFSLCVFSVCLRALWEVALRRGAFLCCVHTR